MKTQRNYYHVGGGSSFLLMTILIWMAGTMNVQAYELYVGGQEVKSSNESGVTGGGIKSGTVTYNYSTKTLTLRNVIIECKDNNTNNKQGIYNQGIVGLVIECYGDCDISSKNNAGLQCDKETYINIRSGTTTIESENSSGVLIKGISCRFASFTSSTELNIFSYSSTAVQGISSTELTLAGKNIEIDGPQGDLVNFKKVYFDGQFYSNGTQYTTGCSVKLRYTGSNSSYPCVRDVTYMPYLSKSDYTPSDKSARRPIVTSPTRADFNSSQKSICYNGTPIYNYDIMINEEFVAVVNARYFPDANFRSYVDNRFGPFITQTQINNCTEIDVSNKEEIASLEGIKYFTKLKTLRCVSCSLTSLYLMYNTELTEVKCDNNQLTSLTVPCTYLQLLSCKKNKLTSCLSNNTHTYLKELYCADNPSMSSLGVGLSYLPALEYFDCSGTKFSSLSGFSTKLKKLTCENMTALTSLTCTGTALTTLSVSECSALKTLNCYNNKLTSLNVYGCKALQTLDCKNNQLTGIAYITHEEGCKKALEELNLSSNKFTSLDFSTFSKLKKLTCENITTLTSLTCTGTALTTLSVYGCSGLKTLNCYNNKLTSLNVYGCSSLQKLDCKSNSSLASISYLDSCKPALQELNIRYDHFASLNLSGFNKLKYLYCADNVLTGLSGFSNNTTLYYLDCSSNQLSSLNLSGCSGLYNVNCNRNSLSSLTLSGLSNLQYLDCSYNSQLTSLNLSASDFPKLADVNCSNCDIRNIDWYDLKLSKLDCSYNTNLATLDNSRDFYNQTRPLTTLNVNGCSALTEINIQCNALTSLDLSSCGNLLKLHCGNNNLNSLGLSNCPNLTVLDCGDNNLQSLSLSNNNNLQQLYCSGNNLSSLYLEGLNNLTIIQCIGCRLTSLNLSGCNALQRVYCYDNQLTSLILPQASTTFSYVDCYQNNLVGSGMDDFVTSLPDRKNLSTGDICMLAEWNENNVLTWKNVKDANRKNWNIFLRHTDGSSTLYTGDVPTDISTAETDIDGNAPRYNLSGQRVGHDYKGVVIVNGKKIFSK